MFKRFSYKRGYDDALRHNSDAIEIGKRVLKEHYDALFKVKHDDVLLRFGVAWKSKMFAVEGELCTFEKKCNECKQPITETFRIGPGGRLIKVRK